MTTSELVYTPLDVIDTKMAVSKEFYFSRQKELSDAKNIAKTDLQFRLKQLKKLYNAVKKNEASLIRAMEKDYHRAPQESLQLELIPLYNDILHMIDCLPKWIKAKRVGDYSPAYMLGSVYVEKIARGSVLVVSPCNFPVLLALTPVANAIAAGNSVVLKPSELTPATAREMQRIIEEAVFPHGLLQVVQGAIPETTQLIRSPTFDMIFYTGSPKVGSIVAQEAGKNLTPCVLELGGKSPAFLTKNFDIRNRTKLHTAMKRLFFGAFSNAGQICVTPDYLVIHESIYDEVIREAKIVLNEMYPEFSNSTDYTHMIGDRGYNVLTNLLEKTQGETYTPTAAAGFKSDTQDGKYCIPPTLVFDCTWDDPLMMEENFGPVLPFYKYSDLDATLDQIIARVDQPLVQYLFSDSAHERQKILTRLRSGDCLIGDTIIHVGIQESPFGGIGTSGYGNYGGQYGYDAFVHERTVFKQPFWMDFMLFMRYAPYTEAKRALVQVATEQRAWFDEDGNDYWYHNRLLYFFSFIGVALGALFAAYRS